MPYDDVKLVLFKVHEDSNDQILQWSNSIGQILQATDCTSVNWKISRGSASDAAELVQMREYFKYAQTVIIEKTIDAVLKPSLTVSSNKSEHVLQ